MSRGRALELDATLTAQSELSAQTSVDYAASVGLSATSTLRAVVIGPLQTRAQLDAISTVYAVSAVSRIMGTSLAATGNLTADAIRFKNASAELDANTTLNAVSVKITTINAALAANGGLNAASDVIHVRPRPEPLPPPVIHVLNRDGEIVATLENKPGYDAIYWDDEHVEVHENNQNTYEFYTVGGDRNPANEYLDIENELVVRDLDGYFRPFVIREAEDIKDDKRTKRIFAEGKHYELSYLKIVEPTTLTGATLQTAAEHVLSGTGWEIGDIVYAGTRSITFEQPMNVLQALHRLRSEFGIELRFRYGLSGNRFTEKRVDFVERTGIASRKEVMFGKDAKSIRRLVDSSSVRTVAYAIGPQDEEGNYLTFSSINDGKPYIRDEDAVKRWGERWYVYQPETEDEEMTPERLLSLTRTDLEKRIAAAVEYEVDAIALERVSGYEHEKVRLGDTIRIKDEYFSPALYLEARVIEIRRSYSAKDRDVFVFGNYREIHPGIDRRVSDLERYVNRVGLSYESRREANERAENIKEEAYEYTEEFTVNYAQKRITSSVTPPENPDIGDLWLNPSTQPPIIRRWDGTAWVKLSTTTFDELTGVLEREQLPDRVIDAAKLAVRAVQNEHIDDDAVTARVIQAEAVGAQAIAANAVLAKHIAAGQVDTNHLAAEAVTADVIAAGAILSQHLSSRIIQSQHISTEGLTAIDIYGSNIVGSDIISESSLDVYTYKIRFNQARIRSEVIHASAGVQRYIDMYGDQIVLNNNIPGQESTLRITPQVMYFSGDRGLDSTFDSIRLRADVNNYVRVSNSNGIYMLMSGQQRFAFIPGADTSQHWRIAFGSASLKSLGGSLPELQARSLGDSSYIRFSAGDFIQQSSRKLKKNIKPFDSRALEKIKQTTVYTYQFDYSKEKTPIEEPEQLGFVYEESPCEICDDRGGVSITGAVAFLWKAVQELTQKVEKLEGGN